MTRTLRPAGRWAGPLWLGLGVLYLAYTILYVSQAGLMDYVAADYRAFRASAEIALEQGLAQVYDLDAQEEHQRRLYAAYATGPGRASYATVPVPYLPLFLLLFLPLLLFDPLTGLVLWTVVNVGLFGLYLWRLWRARSPTAAGSGGLLPAALLCYPLFLNLFFGQVNLLLLVCLGEFLLAGRRGRDLAAGLWLAGLLLKPQALFLLLPGLLLGRRWKMLAGCTAGGLAIGGLSLLAAGPAGIEQVARLLLLYPGELATTVPQLMMNWRALAVNLGMLVPTPLAWGLAIAGLACTTLAAFSFWVRPGRLAGPRWGLAVLGTCAATCAVAWHAHIHMALLLIAPLLLQDAPDMPPRPLANAWAAAPALVFFVAAVALPHAAPNLAGLATLAANMALLAWALRSFHRPPDPAHLTNSQKRLQ